MNLLISLSNYKKLFSGMDYSGSLEKKPLSSSFVRVGVEEEDAEKKRGGGWKQIRVHGLTLSFSPVGFNGIFFELSQGF